jgi:hypothetical protein
VQSVTLPAAAPCPAGNGGGGSGRPREPPDDPTKRIKQLREWDKKDKITGDVGGLEKRLLPIISCLPNRFSRVKRDTRNGTGYFSAAVFANHVLEPRRGSGKVPCPFISLLRRNTV